MGGHAEAIRRHNREVLDHLRRRLVVGEPVTLLGSPNRLPPRRSGARSARRRSSCGFGWPATSERFGFRIELSEVGDPCWEDPIITYETILALLDEAVLVGQRSAPDPEGVVWVS